MNDYQCEEKGYDCLVKGPQVCKSAAGFYIGYYCPECGPWSRESTYFSTEELADRVLQRCEDVV